jgi:ketosteroid isomerase-like protein
MGAQTDQFLTETTAAFVAAETSLHDGDATGRLAMWSRSDPLTLFGAGMNGTGWAQLEPIFDLLAEQFSDCTSYANEIIAAEARGDLAYTVALEHTSASIDGTPTSYVLRVTTIFRREDGAWKIVHRHGDALPATLGADADGPAALTASAQNPGDAVGAHP